MTPTVSGIGTSVGECLQSYEFLVETMPHFVWISDPEGSREYVNQRWFDYTGQPREQGCGWGWIDAVHPDDRELARSRWKECLNSGEAYEAQYRYMRDSDQSYRWHLGRGFARRGPGGDVVQWIGTCTDIQDQKALAQTLSDRTRDLERSNRDLEQFAYVVSHDLQEPLRMVSTYLHLIERRYRERLDATAIEFIDFAVDGAARMRRLIGDMLELSRAGRHDSKPEWIDTEASLHVVLRTLVQRIVDSGAVVEHRALPRILMDESQFSRLMQNLISNAIKFANPGQPARIVVSATLEQRCWIFSVIDNGIGIPPGSRDQVFDVFYRLHSRKVSGSGLGLAICRRIVANHGGRIWIDDHACQGTTVRFSIPFPEGQEDVAPR